MLSILIMFQAHEDLYAASTQALRSLVLKSGALIEPVHRLIAAGDEAVMAGTDRPGTVRQRHTMVNCCAKALTRALT